MRSCAEILAADYRFFHYHLKLMRKVTRRENRFDRGMLFPKHLKHRSPSLIPGIRIRLVQVVVEGVGGGRCYGKITCYTSHTTVWIIISDELA